MSPKAFLEALVFAVGAGISLAFGHPATAVVLALLCVLLALDSVVRASCSTINTTGPLNITVGISGEPDADAIAAAMKYMATRTSRSVNGSP